MLSMEVNHYLLHKGMEKKVSLMRLKGRMKARDVIIEIDNYSYSGTVAYAGLSEIQTNGKDDKAKIDKIANESINFLRGTSNEIKNLTE